MPHRRVLALLLLALPAIARGDAFIPPEGKKGVEVVIGLENAADFRQYTFVVWPHACHSVTDGDYRIIAGRDDDPGRERFNDEFCERPRLFAFPVDAYPLAGGALPPVARAQLTDGPPTDPRVLVTDIDAETTWWTPDELPLQQIRDVYRVEIAGAALELAPTRVLFDFGDRRVLDRPFYRGKRPRLPRERDIPPAPPPDVAPVPSDTAPGSAASPVPSDNSSVPAASDATQGPATSPVPSDKSAAPAAASVPSARTEGDEPPAAPAPSSSPGPARAERPAGIPSALLYGGGCLLVALGAGLALRRR